MKINFTFILFLLFISSCIKKSTNQGVKLDDKINQINQNYNYFRYLNELVGLEEEFLKNNTKRDILVFPIVIYETQPLINSSLYDKTYLDFIYYLNQKFKPANIQFTLKKVESYFSKASLDGLYFNPKFEREFSVGHYSPYAINLYIFNESENVIGFTHYPTDNIQRIYIAQNKLFDPSLIHEFGHYFGLLHTFERTGRSLNTTDCNFIGDKICDTPIDIPDASFVESECRLSKDFFAESGEKIYPDMSNFMSYYGECRTKFSPQQNNRMYFIALKLKFPQLGPKV